MNRLHLTQARVVAVAVVLMVISNLTIWEFTNQHADEQSRKICGVLELLIPQPSDPRPTGERARLIVERSRKAYGDLGCRHV